MRIWWYYDDYAVWLTDVPEFGLFAKVLLLACEKTIEIGK